MFVEVEKSEHRDGTIVSVFLNNPESRNSMTWTMGEEFLQTIESLQKNVPRAVILSGRNNVFCAGGDLNLLKSFASKTYEQNKKDMVQFYSFFLSVQKLPCPVIAAVNGHAIGAGLALAFACDLRIFAVEGKYSFNFVRLGIHPGMGSSYFAPRLCGKSIGNRLLFTGETFSGKEAVEYGIAKSAVTTPQVYTSAKEWAEELITYSPLALQELKGNLYSWKKLHKALKKEAKSQAKNFLSEDFQETLRSVTEKRTPRFRGI